ncbi:MAG: hypothetical protein WGN25_08305 [Candidatus Electrothrix sp. GW3-4]|uniref:hypothetical protein n=1 Tax=Candidatus Electrothrix sp. GW3-4 TaxID=3126740 RepID=UPI0030CBFB43
MNSSQTTQEIELQLVTPQDFVELINALQRIFTIGLYYPSGHGVVDQAMSSFLHFFRRIVGNKTNFLHFAVTEEMLTIQEIELDMQLPSVKSFHNLLYKLNIITLDIHRDITAEEALLFVRKLISFRARIKNCRNFSELKITDLPETIKIRQLQFLTSQSIIAEKGSGDASQPTIDYLLSSLAEQGAKREQLALCGQLLQSIPAAIQKRQLVEHHLPSVTWDDVEKLLFELAESIDCSSPVATTGQRQKKHKKYYNNIDPLIAILLSLEEPRETRQSREAIDLLIDLTRAALPHVEEQDSDTSIGLRSKDRGGISIKQLQKELLLMRNHALPRDFFANERSEQLSLLMQMLGQNPPLQVMMRTHEVLRDCLASELEAREWKVVIAGMCQLIRTLNTERLHFVFIMFINLFRRSRYITPLVFLRDVCQRLPMTEFATCWPFLINELLVEGPQKDPEIFRELCVVYKNFPLQEMRNKLPQLKQLDALSEKKIASYIFSPPPPELYPLLVVLLRSSQAAYISEELLNGLRKQAIGWLDRAVIPYLDSRSSTDQRFIVELLRQVNPAKPSQRLKGIGGQIIVERLPAIPLEQRKEKWVIDSIDALSRIRLRDAQKLLRDIVQSRRYLIIPLWPRAARAAARKVLSYY